MELEIKHLKHYIGTGLSIQWTEEGEIYEEKFDGAWCGVKPDEILIYTSSDKELFSDGIQPILRPLSDLTKPIKHEGEEFVPMEKLFKMLDSADYVDYHGKLENPTYQIDDEWNHVMTFGDEFNSLEFAYGNKGFILYNSKSDREEYYTSEAYSVYNQLMLFEKLFEWHFDVFELIKPGLGIDVNTLEENPYEK